MSIHILPEELVREILSLCLCIHPDMLFGLLRPAYTPPSEQSRNSHLLRVSKRWLRIGTPLLYSSISISRACHTSTIAKFLKEHPEAGVSIRNVRLDPRDGGMERALCDVFRLAPNVERLYVHVVTMKPGMRLVGLEKASHHMPGLKHLCLQRAEVVPRTQVGTDDVAWGLERLVQRSVSGTWVSLKSVTFLDVHDPSYNEALYSAFQKSPSLEEVVLQSSAIPKAIRSGRFRLLAGFPHLKVIRCRGKHEEQTIRKLLDDYKISRGVIGKMLFERTPFDDYLDSRPLIFERSAPISLSFVPQVKLPEKADKQAGPSSIPPTPVPPMKDFTLGFSLITTSDSPEPKPQTPTPVSSPRRRKTTSLRGSPRGQKKNYRKPPSPIRYPSQV